MTPDDQRMPHDGAVGYGFLTEAEDIITILNPQTTMSFSDF